jgi:4-hydroxyproline epimerase
MHKIRVVDSHTEGEPTRVILEGGPQLGSGSLAERRERFRREFDRFRSAVVNEPRGSDPVVGALLVPPQDSACAAGVIFFNNVGYLGMCGHGTIGVVATLAHLGRLKSGVHRIETPVGVVSAELHPSGEVSVSNVPSYRLEKSVPVDVDGFGHFTGDVAWGGNWFFLVNEHSEELDLRNVERLTELTWAIRQSLERDGITGKDGAVIDHVELFGPARRRDADSRNFVLCPGKAYDRSPCGTGTSAKMACLYEDGKLAEGKIWRQESIVGSLFEGHVEIVNRAILATIRGSAYVNAEATLILDERDPFCWGIL